MHEAGALFCLLSLRTRISEFNIVQICLYYVDFWQVAYMYGQPALHTET